MNKQALFSMDGKHRFWLLRSWESNPKMITIIGLNPSIADAENDDPTIQSCIRLTKHAGYGGFVMCNLFTFVTSDPKVLLQNLEDANRHESHDTINRMVANTHKVVCAWGSWKFIGHRAKTLLSGLGETWCFGVNADGSPKHPLFLKSDTALVNYKY